MTPTRMTPARIRSSVVFAGLVFSGLAFVTWTQSWLTIVFADGTSVEVSGDAAAPGLGALSLAALALFASLTIAGPRLRTVLAVLAVGIGALVASSSIGVLVDPAGAAESTVTSVTGVAGAASINLLIDSIVATPWGVVATAAGACLVLTGTAILLTGRRWPQVTRKYSAEGTATAAREDTSSVVPIASPNERDKPDLNENVPLRSSVDDWDSLSNGDDPTRR